MKISTKSLKAIEAILDVAVLGALKPVPLATIGKRQGISLSYLEQMFRKLRERGLVRSTRGPGGGYRLNQRLSAISIADVVAAVDTDVSGFASPAQNDYLGAGGSSLTRGLWSGLNSHLHEYLRSVTLASLLDAGRDDAVARAAPAAQADAPTKAFPTPPPRTNAIGIL